MVACFAGKTLHQSVNQLLNPLHSECDVTHWKRWEGGLADWIMTFLGPKQNRSHRSFLKAGETEYQPNMLAPTRNSTTGNCTQTDQAHISLGKPGKVFEACPNPLLHETNHTLAPMGETRNKLFTHFRTSPSQSINVRTTFYAVMITVHGIC